MRVWLLGWAWLLTVGSARADLFEYVQQKDTTYAWKLLNKISVPQGTVYDLQLTSQTWHDIKWEHRLHIYQPKDVAPTKTMLLFNTGGTPQLTGSTLALTMAGRIGAPVAFLYGIPNQPLYDKREDALIAETFVRYLETKDESWPLLFPMVKSLVRAMDTVQTFAKDEWQFTVEKFVVCGSSKRGWTAWLTAAADSRVQAVAPLVIDTLNMPVQMKHQLASFGQPSAMIKDYVERKLVPVPDTAEAQKLWQMIDPYVHRAKLTMPKFIVNGTNDPYWATDALNLYWDDLPGSKSLVLVPNAGHDLDQKLPNGQKDYSRVLGGLAAFVRAEIKGVALPKLSWQHDDVAGQPRVRVTTDQTPTAVRLWQATAATRDFRQSTWSESAVPPNKDGSVVVTGSVPATGYAALFVELQFGTEQPFYLSTQLRLVPAPGGK
jgi:PhoPQ-activated pathogenicity-related protein